MTDSGAEPPSEKRYKLYRLDLIVSQQSVRDDLEVMRLDEPGTTIGILPAGEKDMGRIMRFTIRHKYFCEVLPDGSFAEPGCRNVDELIAHMNGAAKAGPAPAQSAPQLGGSPARMVNTEVFQTAKTGGTEYRLMPSMKKLGSGPQPARISDKPAPATFSIPDKYKIKPRDQET